LGFLAASAVFCSAAYAREPVPVVNHIDVPVMTGSGKPVTADQVRDAIIKGGEKKDWAVTRSPNSELLSAKIVVRNKHTVVVSISYSAERFSIKYQDSINMNFKLADGPAMPSVGYAQYMNAPPSTPAGTPLIHPGYNSWVNYLLMSIQEELKVL
jgi:hypothetical protein